MNKANLKNNNMNWFNSNKIFKFLFNIFSKFDNLSKESKLIFFICFDCFIIIISYFLTYYFLKDSNEINKNILLARRVLPIMIISNAFFYFLKGEYLSITRYIISSEIYIIAKRNFLLVIILSIIQFIFFVDRLSLNTYLLLWIFNTFTNIISRFSLKELLIYSGYFHSKKVKKVAIFGAGAAGAQLASSLMLDGSHKIIAFFDDSKNIFGRKLLGINIYSSKDIVYFKNKIDQMLIAIPSLSKLKSKTIIEQIKEHEIPVLKIPSIKDLTTGNLSINSLRPIEIDDLLGRVVVEPNSKLLKDSINDFNICITGAGGSIGKEIFRQIVNLKAKSILLIDSNEYSLYQLEQEIKEISRTENKLQIHYKLADVKDVNLLKNLFINYKINVVFHAAAYKHVPLIENNSLQGISNNILGTFSVCQAALYANLSKVTLISTDKAVRPTNIMGATKRFSELIFQGFADKVSSQQNSKNFNDIKYSIVRFGNVLGSSGSVVPLFKKQIASGGPITLTDERVIRYFMTLSEAAQLVIQATSLSKGGDVFILDMGEPIKIKNLAEQMVRLSGLKVKTLKDQNGDIEIITTGLRPGEKLYEELLIGGKPIKTPHPLIFRVREDRLSYDEILNAVNSFYKAINNLDEKKSLQLLSEFVPEWKNNSFRIK